MLHEGAGAHVLSAYVEVVLDNSDRRMPIDHDEVVIRRSIGLKKDEYFIDRKHVTKTEVSSLLETSGLSKANPYNIVPQGRVNALTTSKDSQRLDMLKEVAGVSTFDQRRAESMILMRETADKEAKIQDSIGYLDHRMNELKSEKEELVQAQSLEKKRKVLEYTYLEKELRRTKQELERMDTQRTETSKSSANSSEAEEKLVEGVKEAEKKLKATKSELVVAQQEYQARAAEQKELLTSVAKLEMYVQQGKHDDKATAAERKAAEQELEEVTEQVAEVEAKLAAGAADVAAKRAAADESAKEVDKAESSLQSLHSKQSRTQQFDSQEARDAHLGKEAKELKASLKKKEQQANLLEQELQGAQAKLSEREQKRAEGKQRLQERRREAEVARGECAKLRAQRDEATDQRKNLWRQEQELIASRKQVADDLDKAHRTLQHSMSQQQWEAVTAVKKFARDKKIKGVYGLLIELFTVDQKFTTACEVHAGNQLFQFVVETDEIAQVLVKELQKTNAGRVTFMPLNRLKPGPDPEYPRSEDAIPMMSRLSYDPKYEKALKEVFRKGLIVRTLEVGAHFAKALQLDCVTIAGDQVSRKGAMTGGFLEMRRSRVGAQADILRLTAEANAIDAQQKEAVASLVAIDQKVTRLLGDLQVQELAAQKALAAAELEAIDLPPLAASSSSSGASSSRAPHKASDAQKERAHAALLAAAAADRDRLTTIEAELGSPFTSDLTAAERAEVRALHERLRGLHKERDAAASHAAKAEAEAAALQHELSEHLRKRQEELQATLARLDEDATARVSGERGDAAVRLQESKTKLGNVEAAFAEAAEARESKRQGERALLSTCDELKAQLTAERARQAEDAKALDRMLSRRGLVAQKIHEYTASIRKLGAIPQDALDGMYASASAKTLLAELEKVTKELAKLGNVNKKALDQYASFSEERDRLIAQQEEMDTAREKIEELIEHLDQKKDEAIERTFKGVRLHFSEVFKELVGGVGTLTMTTNFDLPDSADARARVANYSGVAIQVRFPGGGDATSMAQLSGGQKTMVALCLIFAIQRCDPAPFYIFDEIDAALDATHRAALAKMIAEQSSDTDADGKQKEHGATQFITTTIRPELIRVSDQCYGVTHARKVSTIKAIEPSEALRIIAEDENRQRQHIGISS